MISTLLAVLVAQAPEVFVDRGETYVRMGYSQGLTKGVTLDILPSEGGRPIGTAVVMEVWDGLARISLDTAAAAHKGQRLARARPVAPPPPSAVGQPMVIPPSGVAPPPPPPPQPGGGGGGLTTAPTPQVAPQRALHARVQISGGLVDARRFIIYNLDNFDWHGCKIRLPDGRGYDKMEELRANSDEGIMMFRFEPGMALRDASGLVTVYCAEGAGRFAPQF